MTDVREDCAIREMEWQAFCFSLHEFLMETQYPPPSFADGPPTPPQPEADSFAPLMTVLPTMVPADQYTQPGTGSQGQNLLYHSPVDYIPTAASPSDPYNDLLTAFDSMAQHLHPAGELNDVLVRDVDWSVPPLNTPTPKRKQPDHRDEDKPYVKKPPNAFMVFLKEKRPRVKAGVKINGSAAVNAVVGEQWKSLTKHQKAIYFAEAERQRMLHNQLHPNWSSKDNYGKKRRRVRGRTCRTE